jgi:hypothetical protein
MRGKAGEPSKAIADFEHLVSDCRRTLGTDHPTTLAARGNLANWQGRAGDANGAAAALDALQRDCHRALGPRHRATREVETAWAHWNDIATT